MEERQSIKCPVRFSDRQEIRGILKYKVYRHKGDQKELIEEFCDDNLIVNGARNQMARLIAGNVSNRSINRIALGTNGTAPDVADTAITNQFAKAVSAFSYPSMGQVQIDWELLVTENNGMAILEFGLLCADNTLFSRRIRNNPIHKESDISLEGQWTIIF